MEFTQIEKTTIMEFLKVEQSEIENIILKSKWKRTKDSDEILPFHKRNLLRINTIINKLK